MKSIEHSAVTALSPDTRKGSAVPYQFPWLVPVDALTLSSIGGGR